MAVKTRIKYSVPAKAESFPVLRKAVSDGCVVLFDSESTGTILAWSKHPSRVGKHEGNWISCRDTAEWQPCSITLTSED